MNATRIAGAVIGLGAAALATKHSVDHRRQVEQRETAAWEQWRAKLEQQFPGAKLATAADEQRFETFLHDNPAPSWLNVKYHDLRQVSIDAFTPINEADVWGGAPGLAVLGGGFVAALGGAGLQSLGGHLGGGAAARAAAVAGAGLLAAGTVAFFGMLGGSFLGTHGDGLREQVSSTQWHQPTHWYE